MDRLAAMETFVRVVDAGSFSAAARQLRVGQPAVSKVVAQLEERLGVRLLARSTRGLSATEAGLRFYERARNAIAEADEADREARGAGTGLSGSLRVSAGTTFARLHLVPRLRTFLEAHPQLELELILDDRRIDLLEEGVDLALRLGDLPDSASVATRLATGERVVVGAEGYLARAGTPTGPAELRGHEVLSRERGVTWMFTRDAEVVSVAVGSRVRLTGAEGVRAAVLADLGLTIASEWMFTPELASGAVRRLLGAWALPPIDLWAVFPSGRLASAKAKAFAEFVRAALA